MIGAPEKTQVRDITPEVEFQIEPIGHNPLVPTAPISFKREGEDVIVEWPEGTERLHPLGSEQIAADLIERSERDVARHPRSARAVTNLGLAFLAARKFDNATRSFRDALELDPANYVAAINLAKALVRSEDYDEAQELYRRLAARFPEAATPLMSLAHLVMRRGDFAEAEKILRDVIKLGVGGPVPHYQLAIVLIRSRRLHEAIKELRAAMNSDARSPSIYQALGVAYALAGDNAKSSRAFKSALTLSPALGDAVRGLANTLLTLRDADAAIELLASYLEEKPADAQARTLLGRAYGQKRKHGFARTQFLQAFNVVDGHGRFATLQFELANDIGATYYFEGEVQEAERWFSRAIELGPRKGPLPYKNLVRTLTDLEHYDAALQMLKRCKELFREDIEIVLMSSFIHGLRGEYDLAISELTPYLSAENSDAAIFGSLGCYLADARHDYARARDVLSQGYQKFPEDLVIVNNLAYTYLMLGDISKAREVLQTNRTQPGMSVILTATWGLLYLKEGDKPRARALYLEAAKLASLEGNKTLAETVRQKMHLEFALELLKRGDMTGALNEVNLGLKAGKGRLAYNNDLVAAKFTIERQSSH